MAGDISMTPIGTVRSTRDRPDDDAWDSETSSITLTDEFGTEALTGLETFSHVVVIYFFDRAFWDPAKQSRHPRGRVEWPRVGIFAQRAKDRPNRIGVSVCRVVRVEGRTLHLSGLDAIDGTPVLDIKPHMAEFGPRGETFQPEWATELMRDYF